MRRIRRRARPTITNWLVALLAFITAGLSVAALTRTAKPASLSDARKAPEGDATISMIGDSTGNGPTAKPASLSDARKALEGDATISIIGDSTGNGPGEWVDLWAQHLADDGQVTLHQWTVDQYQPEATTYGDGDDKVTIWNAGLPGGQANWATNRIDIVQPKRPDLIILNLGHNNSRTNIAGQLNTLRQEIDQRWVDQDVPLVAILQNPGRAEHQGPQADTLRVIDTWAANMRVPTIDVTSRFTNPDMQMLDQAHPNPLGSKLWADTVANALQ